MVRAVILAPEELDAYRARSLTHLVREAVDCQHCYGTNCGNWREEFPPPCDTCKGTGYIPYCAVGDVLCMSQQIGSIDGIPYVLETRFQVTSVELVNRAKVRKRRDAYGMPFGEVGGERVWVLGVVYA